MNKIWLKDLQQFNYRSKNRTTFTIWVATKEGPEKMKEIESIIKKSSRGLIFSLGNIKDQA